MRDAKAIIKSGSATGLSLSLTWGITYETEPRHVDLLVESMGLNQSKSVSTPGAKDPIPDYDSQKHHKDDSPSGDLSKPDHTLMSETRVSKIHRFLPHNVKLPHAIKLSDRIDCFNVTLYAEMYGTHPRCLAATSTGFMHTSDHCDPYTSKSGPVMQARHAKVNNFHDHAAIHRYRQSMLDQPAIDRCNDKSTNAIAHKLNGNHQKVHNTRIR